MTKHVTIELDEHELARAHLAVEPQGIATEDYLKRLVVSHLPTEASAPHRIGGDASSIFGLVLDGEPTDIGRDKDKLIGEAVWQEYLEETRRK
jgi:hypothetical protein